jgi:hypothetical protein
MAKDKMIMRRKRRILTIDVRYSNQAKTVLGRRKITRQATRKIVTVMAFEVSIPDRVVTWGVLYIRAAANGNVPPVQYCRRILKNAASEATIAVHPALGQQTSEH